MPTVCRVVKHPLQDTVDALLPLLGVDRGRRVRRVRHAEQVEDERQHLRKRCPSGAAGRRSSRGSSRAVAIPDPEEGAPQLQHGQQRDRLPVRDAAALEDRDPARATALDELGAQAALAGARLGDDADHLTVAARARSSAASSPAISRSRPTNAESPRARERSKRVRNDPTASRPKTRTGSLTPLTVIRPRSWSWKYPSTSAPCAPSGRCAPTRRRLHALREPDDCPWAVYSMRRSSPIRPTTTSPELSPCGPRTACRAGR